MPPWTLDTPFGFSIDLSFWQWFFNLPSLDQALTLFALFGWIILFLFFFKAGAEMWVEYRQTTKYVKNWHWVVLAVDVPALFIQTPKAVEQIFAHLSGAAVHIDVRDKFWVGKKQKWFSFEIISIEGYTQFLVRTEVEFRDLLEASIYAQYTEAEITEVEDYVDNIPSRYPDKEYDILGVEFKLAEQDPYPIRTYENFEYNLSKDAVFSDPMAAILENFSRIGHGENLWMHIIVEPTGSGWKEDGINLVKELMGGTVHHHESLLSKFAGIPMVIIKELVKAWNANYEDEGGHEEDSPSPEKLSPGGKKTVEAIEQKISKVGFKSKIRAVYAARKEAFAPNRCIEGIIGALSQFHDINRNSIVPYMSTHAHYDPKHKKSHRLQNTFIKTFKKRKIKWKKCEGYILNIEELATVWHFPLPFVKTPLLQKTGYKRAEPPTGLPTDIMESPLRPKPPAKPVVDLPPEPPPPPDLPYA